MSSPEQLKGGAENTVEVQNAAAERAEKLKQNIESGAELDPRQRAQEVAEARAEANKEALMSKESGSAESRKASEPGFSPTKSTSKKQKKATYKQTMKTVQGQMNAPSRAFSRIIHNPVIEKTSEFIGSTVARPNAIASGAVFAIIVMSGVYLVARTYGYILSGFETIGAFMAGWVLGILYDYMRAMVTGGRQR